MNKTIKILWNTYKIRYKLKELWYIYSYEENAYIKSFEFNSVFSLSHYDEINDLQLKYEEISYIKINEEYIVRQKNIRANNKANKYNNLAWNNYKKSEVSTISQNEKEFLRLWEPIKVWHHSEARHRKLYEKLDKDFERRWQAYKKAEEYNGKAEYWENKRYLTSEEKKSKKELNEKIEKEAINLWKQNHKHWDEFECFANSKLIIKKINQKTVTTESWSRWEIRFSKDFNKYLLEAKNNIN